VTPRTPGTQRRFGTARTSGPSGPSGTLGTPSTLGTLGTLGTTGTLAAGAAIVGTLAAIFYAGRGLTLAHYDAKAHLVVARRILDSLTPNWEQIGAVWLPLPHLINLLPTQIDFFYRTGLFAVAVSIVSHTVATIAIAATILTLTSSRAGAIAGSMLFALNPNVLYLQSTPMSEPLLFALTLLQVCAFTRWVHEGQLRVPTAAGWLTVLACLSRYEAWPITAGCFITSAGAWWRRGQPWPALLPVYARLALFPVITVLAFMAFSRITVGEWFVSGGFFVPDPSLQGQPVVVLRKISEGLSMLGGNWLVRFSILATVVVSLLGVAAPGRSAMLISLSMFAAAALPVAAYLSGHPFRDRYQISLVVASALVIGLSVGLLRRLGYLAAIVVLAIVVQEAPPLDLASPMVREAQVDQHVADRQRATECLRQRYRGGVVMASMGALGHYMQEMSAAGFDIRDFLHEGNGPIWDSAFTRGPAPLVEWVFVEEEAEGGDAIVQRARLVPALLEPFERICAAGGVAVYQRKDHGVPSQGSVTQVPAR
jgi:hypothetical protein